MNELIKIKELSGKYGITTKTLRYYEKEGLIQSHRTNDYAYRMYDGGAVTRLEQILILRKLGVSIKDIKRVFDTSGSEVVLEVLGKKSGDIDEEIALLYELKEVILEFIREIERVNFADNSDVKLLYDKAKEIETQFTNVDYIGKPSGTSEQFAKQAATSSTLERLVEVTDKLDKQIPDVMVVRIPRFRAVTSGLNSWDYVMGQFDDWMSAQGDICDPIIFDGHDFLTGKGHQAEWMWRIKDWVTEDDVNPHPIREFEGGIYALAVSVDGDNTSHGKVRKKIIKWLETTNFTRDEERTELGHMIYVDEEIKRGLGYHQLNLYFPIKIDEEKIERETEEKRQR